MKFSKSVVPRYTVLYSIVKLILYLTDLSRGTFKALPRKFVILELLKLFLIFFRVSNLFQIARNLQYKLAIISILIEVCLFFYEKDYIGQTRFLMEIVFGILSFIFLIFFHPIYYNTEENKKSD